MSLFLTIYQTFSHTFHSSPESLVSRKLFFQHDFLKPEMTVKMQFATQKRITVRRSFIFHETVNFYIFTAADIIILITLDKFSITYLYQNAFIYLAKWII